MPRASKETAAATTQPGYEWHFQDLEGGFSVAFATFTEDLDPAESFAAMPGGRCPCPHWGYVVSGKVVFTFEDGSQEAYGPGDAYYAPPGHTTVFSAGTEMVEFSPTEAHHRTMAVVSETLGRDE